MPSLNKNLKSGVIDLGFLACLDPHAARAGRVRGQWAGFGRHREPPYWVYFGISFLCPLEALLSEKEKQARFISRIDKLPA